MMPRLLPGTAMILSTRNVFTGRVITANVEQVRLPNGSEAALEIVHHPGGAAVVAVDAQRRVCLLRQFRHAADGWLYELPAGKLDNREPPLECATRELAEEAGRTAQHWQPLGDIATSPGVFTEVIHLFLARSLAEVTAQPEEHEVLEVHWFPLDDALRMAADGRIRDAKTIAGLFRAGAALGSGAVPALAGQPYNP
jgi:8-oxo-dGTP pyrophosphatase MutT (NUDIX family)